VLASIAKQHTFINASSEKLATEQFDHWIGVWWTDLRSFTTTHTAHSINTVTSSQNYM